MVDFAAKEKEVGVGNDNDDFIDVGGEDADGGSSGSTGKRLFMRNFRLVNRSEI